MPQSIFCPLINTICHWTWKHISNFSMRNGQLFCPLFTGGFNFNKFLNHVIFPLPSSWYCLFIWSYADDGSLIFNFCCCMWRSEFYICFQLPTWSWVEKHMECVLNFHIHVNISWVPYQKLHGLCLREAYFVCKWNLYSLHTPSIIYLQFVAMLFFMGHNLVFSKIWKLWLSLKKWHHNFCQTDEETKVLKIQPQVEDWKNTLTFNWDCETISMWSVFR